MALPAGLMDFVSEHVITYLDVRYSHPPAPLLASCTRYQHVVSRRKIILRAHSFS